MWVNYLFYLLFYIFCDINNCPISIVIIKRPDDRNTIHGITSIYKKKCDKGAAVSPVLIFRGKSRSEKLYQVPLTVSSLIACDIDGNSKPKSSQSNI